MPTQKTPLGKGRLGILIGIFGFATFFLIKSIIALNSGGTRQLPDGTWIDTHITIWNTGYIVYAIALYVFCGVAYLIMRSEQ